MTADTGQRTDIVQLKFANIGHLKLLVIPDLVGCSSKTTECTGVLMLEFNLSKRKNVFFQKLHRLILSKRPEYFFHHFVPHLSY